MAALALFLFALSAQAFGAPTRVLVEIDTLAERFVDARSARRLIPLELSEIALPPSSLRQRQNPTLFFRVLGSEDGGLRVELWELGEFHGARLLAAPQENAVLVARRVALAAAELGRRLARKRSAQLAREAREDLAQQRALASARYRALEGPRALRSEFLVAGVAGGSWFVGPRLTGELSITGRLRLDLGAEALAGSLEGGPNAGLYALALGPAYRVGLGRSLALDLSADAAALLVRAPGARALDGEFGGEAAGSARVRVVVRGQLRLQRTLRLSLGAELGGLLRPVSFVPGRGEELRKFEGWWLGAALGLVVTPAAR